MNKYNQQAADFLSATDTTITKEFVKYDIYFQGEKEKRNIRSITLNNKRGSYTFSYGDSIFNSADRGVKKRLGSRDSVFNNTDRLVKKETSSRHIKNMIDALKKKDWKSLNILDCNEQDLKYLDAVGNNNSGSYPPKITIDNLIPKEVSDYDILACLDLTYEDSFEDRCDSFGYDTDSKSAEVIYHKCIEQDRMLRRLFDTKELELLSEIN